MGTWQNTLSTLLTGLYQEMDNHVLRKSRSAYKARDLQSSTDHVMSYYGWGRGPAWRLVQTGQVAAPWRGHEHPVV